MVKSAHVVNFVNNFLWLQPYVHIYTPSHSHALNSSHSISDQSENILTQLDSPLLPKTISPCVSMIRGEI